MNRTVTKSKRVFRPTVSEDSLLGTIEVLQHYRSIYGLNSGALALLVKFEQDAISIGYGTKAPAYVTSGVRKESSINLGALGCDAAESESTIGKYNNSAELDDNELELLKSLEADMLAGLVAEGSKSVIVEESRIDRTRSESGLDSWTIPVGNE